MPGVGGWCARVAWCGTQVEEGSDGSAAQQLLRDQQRVLSRRKGRLLNRRTILKSYLFHAQPPLPGQPHVELVSNALGCGCGAVVHRVPRTAPACAFGTEALGAKLWGGVLRGAASDTLPACVWRVPCPVLCAQAPDLRCALDNLPIYCAGSLTREGLRAVLQSLGAAQGGRRTICISDIREVRPCCRDLAAGGTWARGGGREGGLATHSCTRAVIAFGALRVEVRARACSLQLHSLQTSLSPQELVVYVNGTPYTRRELEMPAAALHHAGVQATQVTAGMGLTCTVHGFGGPWGTGMAGRRAAGAVLQLR